MNPAVDENSLSLKNLALHCVVEHFENYMQVQDATKAHSRCLEFLQRKYSYDLIQRLSEKSAIQQKYLNFLVNSHLKRLSLKYLISINSESLLHRLKEVGENIKVVDVGKQLYPEQWLISLTILVPNVEVLLLSNTLCSNNVLKYIGKNCPIVNELDISFCFYVTDHGILSLCPNNVFGKPNLILRTLNIIGTSTTDVSINFCLSHFRLLTIFKVDDVCKVICDKYASDFKNGFVEKIPNYYLSNLTMNLLELTASCYQEEKLNFSVRDAIELLSIACPRVTSVEINAFTFDQHDLICAKAVISSLKDLHISLPSPMLLTVPNFLATCGHFLQTLNLSQCTISVIWLTHCSKLERLVLYHVTFSNYCDIELSQCAFSGLKYMAVYSLFNFTKPEEIKSMKFLLSRSPQLQVLEFLIKVLPPPEESMNAIFKDIVLPSLREFISSFTEFSANTAMLLIKQSPALRKITLKSMSEKEYRLLQVLLAKEKRVVVFSWPSQNIKSLQRICEFDPLPEESLMEDDDSG